ncbi:Alpha/beta hydrolase domain-containing protein 17A [Fasciola hepatica]|uniref:Alpha/beta hydrolase domain-containing protein 17A n=1 Tax=Fasciola hepatica TaxID=6192 RepID=A0A4E0QZR0_FASHE|nr:Alpha/beta hydrolase domain-containing protein 17A [Fasciola hepatica]
MAAFTVIDSIVVHVVTYAFKYELACHQRAPRILSPTLIIHGTHDEVIHPINAVRLYRLIPNTLEPLFIRGAGHNNCELFQEYFSRLQYFVCVELNKSKNARLVRRRTVSLASVVDELSMPAHCTRRRAKIRPVPTACGSGTQHLPNLASMASRYAAQNRRDHRIASASRPWFSKFQKQSHCSISNGLADQAQTSSITRTMNLASLSSESEEFSNKDEGDDCFTDANDVEEGTRDLSSSRSSTRTVSRTRASQSTNSHVATGCESKSTRKRWLFWSSTN